MTYETLEKNKMQIGFGISSPERVKEFIPYCDGVIVGSAIIQSLRDDDKKYSKTLALVNNLKEACYF
jgi:tryptophan synthase alpha chain